VLAGRGRGIVEGSAMGKSKGSKWCWRKARENEVACLPKVWMRLEVKSGGLLAWPGMDMLQQ